MNSFCHYLCAHGLVQGEKKPSKLLKDCFHFKLSSPASKRWCQTPLRAENEGGYACFEMPLSEGDAFSAPAEPINSAETRLCARGGRKTISPHGTFRKKTALDFVHMTWKNSVIPQWQKATPPAAINHTKWFCRLSAARRALTYLTGMGWQQTASSSSQKGP